jgi:hypothetical protein
MRRGINPLPLKFRLTQRTYLHVRDENSSHRVSIIILANNHETLNRVFEVAARPSVVAAVSRPLMESGARSEYSPAQVSPLLLRRSRFAVSPHLGCAVFLQRTGPMTV